ncbi:hypothetical protein DERP_014167 [Dermatophagoides pteronyssinus]|uniref:Uncharacterized protein n=1 Tax=Dermatophagoides pteronyssinus TaxID=6956 RepID=A0ABQ8IX57_DERPT|nr:hypothetical protein DERP_014167 [Dermatophagoides pteronyssinus]
MDRIGLRCRISENKFSSKINQSDTRVSHNRMLSNNFPAKILLFNVDGPDHCSYSCLRTLLIIISLTLSSNGQHFCFVL